MINSNTSRVLIANVWGGKVARIRKTEFPGSVYQADKKPRHS